MAHRRLLAGTTLTANGLGDYSFVAYAVSVTCNALSIGGCVSVLAWSFGWRDRQSGLRADVHVKMARMLLLLDIFTAGFLIINPNLSKEGVFCDLQGFGLYQSFMCMVLWHVVIGNVVWQWIVKRRDVARHQAHLRVSFLVIFLGTLGVNVYLYQSDRFAYSGTFCFVKDKPLVHGLTVELPIFAVWIHNIVVFLAVTTEYRKRRLLDLEVGVSLFEYNVALRTVKSKLLHYLVAFTLCNVVTVTGFSSYVHVEDVTLQLINIILTGLRGFVDACIYGGLFDASKIDWLQKQCGVCGETMGCIVSCCQRCSDSTLGGCCCYGASQREKPESAEHGRSARTLTAPVRRSSVSSNGSGGRPPTMWEFVAQRQSIVSSSILLTDISIFVTTLNVGECSVKKLGSVHRWIPNGYDIYAVGMQEVTQLAQLREAIHRHLGGSAAYNIYTNEIGQVYKALGYHGHIALTVYVRASLVTTGAVAEEERVTNNVRRGKNLVLRRASNKGAVGLAFRIHDARVAFLSAHMAADSKGRRRGGKRNADARDILARTVLVGDDLGINAHLSHHHLFVLGDLNYRVGGLAAEDILDRVADACKVEKELWEKASAGAAHECLHSDEELRLVNEWVALTAAAGAGGGGYGGARSSKQQSGDGRGLLRGQGHARPQITTNASGISAATSLSGSDMGDIDGDGGGGGVTAGLATVQWLDHLRAPVQAGIDHLRPPVNWTMEQMLGLAQRGAGGGNSPHRKGEDSGGGDEELPREGSAHNPRRSTAFLGGGQSLGPGAALGSVHDSPIRSRNSSSLGGSLTGVLAEHVPFLRHTWRDDKYWLLMDPAMADRRQEALKALAASVLPPDESVLPRGARRLWDELLAHDELSCEMAREERAAFLGFVEAPITFPPSFRRKRFAEGACGDYTDAARLKAAYTTSVKERGSGAGKPPEPVVRAASGDGPSTPGRESSAARLLRENRDLSGPGEDPQGGGGDPSAPLATARADSSPESKRAARPAGSSSSPVRDFSRMDSDAASDSTSSDDERDNAGGRVPGGNGTRRARSSSSTLDTTPDRLSMAERRRREESGAVGGGGAADGVGAKGLRPPSWTDRILTHSLPDKRDRLEAGPYELCDALLGSDHRPVCGAFTLKVSPLVKSRARGNAVAEVTLRISNISITRVDASAASWERGESESGAGAAARTGTAAAATGAAGAGPGLDDVGAGLADSPQSKRSGDAVAFIDIVFPLPAEDPILSHRRVINAAATMGLTNEGRGGRGGGRLRFGSRATDSGGSNTTSAARRGYNPRAPYRTPRSKRIYKENRFDSMMTCDFEAASRYGVGMTAHVWPAVGMHAAVKLTNALGEDKGQALLSLSALWRLRGTVMPEPVRVPLGLGGGLVGWFECSVEMEVQENMAMPTEI